ncbi:sulfate permease [Vibrio ishigakensis]|uniref:Sulfate permease n=1 Tax=Vibrio ishigakensis TaxID=1481914 RepID=A0A0B8QEU3_9VIBR|nr:sulfate permease [Vibrio ishigakensis]
MSESAKYILGIDLGTTHSVLSYTEKHLEDASVEIMPIPQLTAPGQVESLNQLGSFIYQASEHEMGEGSRSLPWTTTPEALVGAVARKLGSKTPLRLVASAKSCYAIQRLTAVRTSCQQVAQRRSLRFHHFAQLSCIFNILKMPGITQTLSIR